MKADDAATPAVIDLAGSHGVLRALSAGLSCAFGALRPLPAVDTVCSYLYPHSRYLGLQLQLDEKHVLSVSNEGGDAVGQSAVLELQRSFANPAKAQQPVSYRTTKACRDFWGPNPPAGPVKGALLAVPLLVDPGAELVAAMLVESQQAGSCPTAMFRVWHRYAPYESCIGVLLMEVPRQLPTDGMAQAAEEGDVLATSMCNLMLVGAMLGPLLLLHGRQRICDAALVAGLIAADKRYAYIPGSGLVEGLEEDCEAGSSSWESPDEVSEGADDEQNELYSESDNEDEVLGAGAELLDGLVNEMGRDALALRLYQVVGRLARHLPDARMQRLPRDVLRLLASLYEHDEVGSRAEALLTGGDGSGTPVPGEVYSQRRAPGRAFCDIRWQSRGGHRDPPTDRDDEEPDGSSRSRLPGSRGGRQQQEDGQTDIQESGPVSAAGSSEAGALAEHSHQGMELQRHRRGEKGPSRGWDLAGAPRAAVNCNESMAEDPSNSKQQQQQAKCVRDAETQMYTDQAMEQRYVLFAWRTTQQVHRWLLLLVGGLLCVQLLASQPFSLMQRSPLLAAIILAQLLTMVVLDNWPVASARQAIRCEFLFTLVGASISLRTFPLLCLCSLPSIVKQHAVLPGVVLLLLFCFLGHLGGRVRYYWCRMNAFTAWLTFFVWVLPKLCQTIVPAHYYAVAFPSCSLTAAGLTGCTLLSTWWREALMRHQFERSLSATAA